MRDIVRHAAVIVALIAAMPAVAEDDLEFNEPTELPNPDARLSGPDTDPDAGDGEIRDARRRQDQDQAVAPEQDGAAGSTPDAWWDMEADRAFAITEAGLLAQSLAAGQPEKMTVSAGGAPAAGSLGLAVRNGGAAATDANALPEILSDADAALYREIFRLQRKGRWRKADKAIKNLSDPILLGHVLHQRYMHPRRYRAKYKELSGWMKKYRDHPDAERVYQLALKRRPKNYRRPPRPAREPALQKTSRAQDRYANRTGYQSLSSWKRKYIRTTQRRIRYNVYRGRTTRALRLLNAKKTRRVFDAVSLDESRSQVAGSLFQIGQTQRAFELAAPAAERSGDAFPMAHWWAGLAAWRIGKPEVAAQHFGAMTEADLESGWMLSAAAYWSARAHLVSHQPKEVNRYLKIAAQFPRTFYGLLAIRSLGVEPAYDWSLPPVTPQAWRSLQRLPQFKRAVALIQVGETARAEKELRRRSKNVPPGMARILASLAVQHNLPSLALRIGRTLRDRDNEVYDAVLYPLPEWEPRDGFRIDKALVFAVMRQESRFSTRAKSRAGARGLMQLMPRTAGYMAGRRFRGAKRHKLFDPELNITLGQKYVEHLLEDPYIDGDLFYTVAAYNGGPGNLRKWRRRTDHQDDPLLFIESIPLSETRDYVERVLTNLWIYRYRLGQMAPSLDAIAAGEWPSYTPQDNKQGNFVAKAASGL